MPYVFEFPDVGEGLTEGTVVKLHVKEGQTVKEDDVLFEVETAKAVVEIPSPVSGKIAKILFKEGDTINVGQKIMVFLTEEDLKKGIDSLEKLGGLEAVLKGETTKEEKKEEQESKEEEKLETVEEEKKAEEEKHATKKVLASPAARKLANELGYSLEEVAKALNKERLERQDIIAYKEMVEKGEVSSFEKKVEEKEKKEETVSTTTFVSEETTEGKEEIIEVKGVRKEIVKKMNLAHKVPVAVAFDEIDVTKLEKLRKEHKQYALEKGIKLTMLAFVVNAVCKALKKHKMLNSSMTEDESKIIVKHYIHMGIAVDTEEGLKVVVIRNADKKSILAIAKEMQELAEKARNKKASLQELTGSTFTISNIGSIGGKGGIAVLNYPEAAILLLGRAYKKLEFDENKNVVEKLIMPVSLTFDHRIIDGADAQRFLNDVKEFLEKPEKMLFE